MNHRDRFEIRIAGLGGQGVVTIGRVLGIAFSVYEGLNSVNTQSYGPESRGGACRSEVVVSSGAINYPYVRRADLFVCLTQTALEACVTDLAPDGVLLADRDGVMDLPRRPGGRGHPGPVHGNGRSTGWDKVSERRRPGGDSTIAGRSFIRGIGPPGHGRLPAGRVHANQPGRL